MPPNSNFTTLIATTLQNFSNSMFNNVVTNNAALLMLQKAGNIKIVSGGRQFVHQLLYAKNSSFAARGKLDTIDLPVTDPLTASQWNIKIVDGSLVLPTLDVAMNSGSREKLLDYTNAKKLEAEVSMTEVLGDQIFGSSPGSDDMDSIPSIIREDVTADTSVGGINQSDNSWWRNYSYDTSVTAFNTSQAGFTAIDTSLNQTIKGRMGPKLHVTTPTIFTLFQLGLTSNMRYRSEDLELGKAGFKALEYAGAPVVFDDNCPSGNWYGIDTESIKLQVLTQGNMKQTPFQFSTNQLVESALIYMFTNLTSGSRRTSFVIDSITG